MRAPRSSLIAFAALNGFVAVAAGAFAAHGIDDLQAKDWLRTGALYQLAHAIAALAILERSRPAAWLFNFGGLAFAGTLYAMALGAPRILGAVTPVGGLLLLAGWVVLFIAALRGEAAKSA
jgi:uncharacterized membrane protein YgdD (TMEM256/DUF423 family)